MREEQFALKHMLYVDCTVTLPDVTLTDPFTSSFDVGAVVPMPTLPDVLILMYSVPPVIDPGVPPMLNVMGAVPTVVIAPTLPALMNPMLSPQSDDPPPVPLVKNATPFVPIDASTFLAGAVPIPILALAVSTKRVGVVPMLTFVALFAR